MAYISPQRVHTKKEIRAVRKNYKHSSIRSDVCKPTVRFFNFQIFKFFDFENQIFRNPRSDFQIFLFSDFFFLQITGYSDFLVFPSFFNFLSSRFNKTFIINSTFNILISYIIRIYTFIKVTLRLNRYFFFIFIPKVIFTHKYT